MNFSRPGSFWLEWFGSGENPIETFENLSPADLKELAAKIKDSSLYLVGFLSYEWGAALEGIGPVRTNDTLQIPLNWFGLYEKVPGTICNKSQKSAFKPLKGAMPSKIVTQGARHFSTSVGKEDYLRAIQKILNYLKEGDCYQVNLSQRFETKINEEPWVIYQRLREISPAPYACFLNTGDFQILSSSPELFLKADADGTLTTKPIKGTRGRGRTPEEDEILKKELQNNPKDKAELLMITDLERNDLGKVCQPSSVQVPELQAIETYAQVHHLVSTVTGKRKSSADIIDVLVAMMPGGSITGAPKIRAMEIIRELEPIPRGVYTGAIGWIGPNNTAHFNIAIRTITIQKEKATFHAGGGIVIDSKPELEYEETLTKASGMMKALKAASL